VRLLAEEYGVRKTALQDRVNGKSKPLEIENAELQRMTVLGELALIEWVYQLEAWRFPPRVESLRRMVVDMLLDKEDPDPLGVNWQTGFLFRHPEFKLKFIPPLDKERAMAQNISVFERYFALFWAIVEEYDILLEDIWNIDENGFMQGVIVSRKMRVRPLSGVTDPY
jgi:hypothetical protein